MSDYTREQILSMQGRELDMLIAKHVMGYEISNLWDGCAKEKGRSVVFPIPSYSTDISTAWEVIEKMKKDNWGFVLSDDLYVDRWSASFYWDPNQTLVECVAKQAPLAICKASLLAVMGL